MGGSLPRERTPDKSSGSEQEPPPTLGAEGTKQLRGSQAHRTTEAHATISALCRADRLFPFQLDDEQLDQAIAEMLEPTSGPGFDDHAGVAAGAGC